MKDLNPWFVVTSLVEIARYPTGALELIKTVPSGYNFKLASFNPPIVTSISPFFINLFPLLFDKAFFEEHKSEIALYENSLSDLKKSYSKLPNSKDILKELDSVNEKKNTLMQEYSSAKSDMKELYQIRKNYEKYMGKEMER